MIKKFFLLSLFMILSGVFYGEMNIREDSSPGLNMQISSDKGMVSEAMPLYSDFDLIKNFGADYILAASTPQKSAASKKPSQPAPKKPAAKGSGPSALNICGYVLMAAGVGGLGAGYYFDTQASSDLKAAQSKYDDYKNASSGFDDKWSAYQDKLNLSKQDVQYRNISYIAGGVSLGAGVILALLPSNPKKRVGIYITPDSVYVAYRF